MDEQLQSEVANTNWGVFDFRRALKVGAQGVSAKSGCVS